MQRVITVRASQSDLNVALGKIVSSGWKVLSTTRGSEWGRVGFSYKWTVILERPDTVSDGGKYSTQQMENCLSEALSSATKKSYIKAFALFGGLLVGLTLFFVIMFAVI